MHERVASVDVVNCELLYSLSEGNVNNSFWPTPETCTSGNQLASKGDWQSIAQSLLNR
ncbi:MAG: hypothetical protein ACRDAP_04890 [Shewanella sp.]